VENKIGKARRVTSVLTIVPYSLFALQIINSFIQGGVVFWALFCYTLFPFSILVLYIHFFVDKKRREQQLPINNWDAIKIGVAVVGSVVGLLLWGLLVIVTS
jgi:hypothetical protein